MTAMLQEILYSLRSLRRTRGFTAVAVITLALGIAATTLVFTVINAVMLRPLPYPNQDQLVIPRWVGLQELASGAISAPAFFMLQERPRSFQSVAAIYDFDTGVNLITVGTTQYVKAMHVSVAFFRTLGITPVVGREFRPEEDQPGGQRVAIISYRLWELRFGKEDSVLGKGIRINGNYYVVVGVMPRGFRSYPSPDTDLWLPLQLDRATAEPDNSYRVIARLKDGISLEDAQNELDASKDYRLTFPLRTLVPDARLVLVKLNAYRVARFSKDLLRLFGAVAFVLLIACTNLAVLLMVRASARSQEIAIRAALGAGRGRLIGTFLIESALIAMMGGVLGIILAKESIPFMLWLLPENLPHTAPIAIDGRVVLFAVAISALTSLIFGLAPALKMSRANLNKLLRQSSYGASAGPQQTRTGRLLVSAQSALTLILLAGSIMLLRSFLTLHAVPPGFDPQHVWVAQVSLAANRYQTTTASTRLLRQICTQIRDYPGVEAVASVTGLPLEQGLNLPIYADEKGKDTPEYAEVRIVSADYFRVMRIPLLAGRSFANGDAAGSAPAVIINETLARRWWPGQSSLGHFVTASSIAGSAISDLPRQIVGVVADMREAGLGAPPRPTIFVPLDQTPDSISAFVNKPIPASIVIRVSKGTADLSEYLHTVLNTADPDLSVASWRPLADVVSTSLAAPRFYASVTTAFGTFGLLLTAIGLYGLLSYQLVLRTREIAVRVALGARRSRVIVLIVRQGIQLVAFGAALGMAGVPFLARLLGTMLYNLSGVTFGILAGATLLLVAVAALTSLLTAARAAAIDPIVALRTE